jgi:hypothetical protein
MKRYISFNVSNKLNKINSKFGKKEYNGDLNVSRSIISPTKDIIEIKVYDNSLINVKLDLDVFFISIKVLLSLSKLASSFKPSLVLLEGIIISFCIFKSNETD